MTMPETSVPIDLALQGGGSHGAFTWGVLDGVFDDPGLTVTSLSGTSAGAMNAVVAAHGFQEAGPRGAKAALEKFWNAVSEAARFSPIRRTAFDKLAGNWSLDRSPGYLFYDLFSRLFSPYEFNPANLNPLRDILEASVDFKRLRDCPMKLFINATNVRTGLPRIFRNAELSADVVLASACLPLMHQAVEIDGEAYWDGGFSGNPLLTPVIHESTAKDIVLVQINPIERPQVPRTAREILDRVNEISFNSSLKKELRGIAILRKMLAAGNVQVDAPWFEQWSQTRLHRISSTKLTDLGSSSKLNAEWDFLLMLREEGQRAAAAFLAEHRGDLGQRSTLDIDTLLDTFLEQT